MSVVGRGGNDFLRSSSTNEARFGSSYRPDTRLRAFQTHAIRVYTSALKNVPICHINSLNVALHLQGKAMKRRRVLDQASSDKGKNREVLSRCRRFNFEG